MRITKTDFRANEDGHKYSSENICTFIIATESDFYVHFAFGISVASIKIKTRSD